jgi:hypothetical protein
MYVDMPFQPILNTVVLSHVSVSQPMCLDVNSETPKNGMDLCNCSGKCYALMHYLLYMLLLNNSMEQIPSCAANNVSASQENHGIL